MLLIDKIKEWLWQKDKESLDISDDVNKLVLKQFKLIIKDTNKQLLESIKRKPVGEGSTYIQIENDDMRSAVKEYYQSNGYNVKEETGYYQGHTKPLYLYISFKNWRK